MNLSFPNEAAQRNASEDYDDGDHGDKDGCIVVEDDSDKNDC